MANYDGFDDDVVLEENDVSNPLLPINFMSVNKGSEIVVVLRDKEEVKGILKAYDLYLNMTLATETGNKFISGQSIMYVYTM